MTVCTLSLIHICNWVEDILLYDKAQSNIPNNGEIDKLVENYRKALIMHKMCIRDRKHCFITSAKNI